MNTTEHLLTCTSEECVEVSKDIHKALRFGLHDVYEKDPLGRTVQQRIVDKLNDLLATIEMLEHYDILPRNWRDEEKQIQKRVKVRKYLAYSHSVGTLTTPVPNFFPDHE